MDNKAVLPSKGLPAHVANIRPLPHVCSHVNVEMTTMIERLTTNITFKRFLPLALKYMSN